jgi:hypothetical protein
MRTFACLVVFTQSSVVAADRLIQAGRVLVVLQIHATEEEKEEEENEEEEEELSLFKTSNYSKLISSLNSVTSQKTRLFNF